MVLNNLLLLSRKWESEISVEQIIFSNPFKFITIKIIWKRYCC